VLKEGGLKKGSTNEKLRNGDKAVERGGKGDLWARNFWDVEPSIHQHESAEKGVGSEKRKSNVNRMVYP